MILGFSFVICVFFARMLSHSDYGVLAMIAVLNAITIAFVNSGFGNTLALIRKPEKIEDDNHRIQL